jgi:hypothetical protein
MIARIETSSLPLALRKHVPADVKPAEALGETDQEWTWEPSGKLNKDDLRIYATGGYSTSRQTYQGTWDHGESW